MVFPHAVGRHRNSYAEGQTRAGSRKRISNETTESRDEVKYSKGRIFLNPAPVAASSVVGRAKMALCYGSTLVALALRLKGKSREGCRTKIFQKSPEGINPTAQDCEE